MGTLLQDTRYGLRMLVKKPTFTIVAVLPSRRIIPIDRDHEATLDPGQWHVKDGKLKKKS